MGWMVYTLDAQHLPQLEGRSAHLGEFGDKTFHVSGAEHEGSSAFGLTSSGASQAFTDGAKGHGCG